MRKSGNNKMNITHRAPWSVACGVSIALLGSTAMVTQVQAAEMASNETMEEVISLGSRSARARTASDSTVPIDSISGDDFDTLGNAADITDNLKAFVPSYTASPATGDGSAFVRPTSLRGLAPDQTLVLVNGKRRHRSALVHFFAPAAGNGAHGPDIGMIPSNALKRIDVLRDGASSQYGADAIAGVMNFVLKDASEGGSAMIQYGQFYEGEQSVKVAANGGFPMTDAGFFNLSVESIYNEGLSRGFQRKAGQDLVDAGVTGVGADSPFDDSPLVQSWGRPESKAVRFFFNSGIDVTDNAEAYLHGNYAQTDGIYRFFYRAPGHDTITGATPGAEGLATQAMLAGGTLISPITSVGYTPFLEGDQKDFSLVGGVKGLFFNDWNYDFSVGYGSNLLDYELHNTTNPSLGIVPLGGGSFAIPQRSFDVGAYEQTEVNVNLDFSGLLTDTLNVAWGFEYRDETFEAIGGEFSSYFGQGSNGLAGIGPANAGEFSRSNYAAYLELEKDFSDQWVVQLAGRFEDFSDFGSTINGKLASRYRINESWAIRGSASTGFHAPTPGQSNVTTTITTFDGTSGAQEEERLVTPTSAEALPFGGKALTEEESRNLSIGFTTNFGASALTVDYYDIDVDGRIYRTGNIPTVIAGETISFYTNSLDISSMGVDVVFTTGFDFLQGSDLTLALNWNDIEVTGQTLIGGVQTVSDGTVEDIENNYPNLRFVVTSTTQLDDRWNLMLRANYYGKHFDERGEIGKVTGSGGPSAEIGAVVFFDAELGYQMNDALKLVVGGANIFDEFVDEIDAPNANRQSVGLQYPRRSAANYEGGSWYVAAHYSF